MNETLVRDSPASDSSPNGRGRFYNVVDLVNRLETPRSPKPETRGTDGLPIT
jgi:hypothetical protein